MSIDHEERISIHRLVLKRKRLLKSAFNVFYREMLSANAKFLSGEGSELELGTGAGFMKELRTELITSDVFPVQGIDRVIDAQKMDLEDASVRCIYAINVFHHLPDPEKFLHELSRVLVKGGGCILIEPHNGLASRMLHTYMHSDEHFDAKSSSWQCLDIRGPMSGANQALSYIVFERDQKLFESRFGDCIEIVEERYIANFLRYFLSGGLNYRQLAPDFFAGFLAGIETALTPVAKHVTFHRMTVLRKK
jgi:SAM-dependent methyltransferase